MMNVSVVSVQRATEVKKKSPKLARWLRLSWQI